VSLNNAAIALMERGRCCQALAVMRGALRAMKMVTELAARPAATREAEAESWRSSKDVFQIRRGGSVAVASSRLTSGARGVASESFDVEGLLKQASRYVLESCQPVAVTTTSMPVVSRNLALDCPVLDLKRDDTDPSSYSTATLIRIEVSAHPMLAEGDSPDLESAVVLYNSALVILLRLSSLPDVVDSNDNASLRRTALSLLGLASIVAARLLQGHAGAFERDCPNRMLDRIAIIQMILLVSRWAYRIHADLGEDEEAARAMDRFRAAQEALMEEEGMRNRLDGPDSAHAKAA
jgi:hypothetical protein